MRSPYMSSDHFPIVHEAGGRERSFYDFPLMGTGPTVKEKELIVVLLILLIAITSLLLASCPVDQPLIFPP